MKHRRRASYGSLISLLDVLFILVFAALAQAHGLDGPPDDGDAAAEAELEPDAGVEDAGDSEPTTEETYDRALAKATAALYARTPIHVRISIDGTIAAIDASAVSIPLLERVADPNVGLAYLGDSSVAMRVCQIVARHTGLETLDEHLVIIVGEAAIREMPVALVRGLQRDQQRCGSLGGVAVLLDKELR